MDSEQIKTPLEELIEKYEGLKISDRNVSSWTKNLINSFLKDMKETFEKQKQSDEQKDKRIAELEDGIMDVLEEMKKENFISQARIKLELLIK